MLVCSEPVTEPVPTSSILEEIKLENLIGIRTMTNSHRITINQIARDAGVSKQTVSRVLNNRPDVAPETRQRVQSIIDRKGYRPSKLARGLTQGRSYTIGVISSGVHQFGPSQILSGIEVQTRALGYTLYLNIIDEVDQTTVTSALSNMVAQYVDGIVWSPMPRVHDSHYHLGTRIK